MGATPLFKDKDGDDNEINRVTAITLSQVSNGWIVTTSYEDEDEIVEVFNTEIGAIQAVVESMGQDQNIVVKSKK